MSTVKESSDIGIVLYTDGGANPNPGFAGWGMHGYVFKDVPPKKGTGNTYVILTSKGYRDKVEATAELNAQNTKNLKHTTLAEIQVTPLLYVDGLGVPPGKQTNNVGELFGAIKAIEYAIEIDTMHTSAESDLTLRTLTIITDSEYVSAGYTKGLPRWKSNGWVNLMGKTIANLELWQRLNTKVQQLIDKGVKIKINWVKGHADDLGNILADRAATIGVRYSQELKSMMTVKDEDLFQISVVPAEGYWASEVEKHPFFYHKRMYNNSDPERYHSGEYYLGEHGKEDDMAGTRRTDGTYSLIRLIEPNKVVEDIRQYQSSLASDFDRYMITHLDNVFKKDTFEEIAKHGPCALVRTVDRKGKAKETTVRDSNSMLISTDMSRPKICERVIDCISELGERLEGFLKRDPGIFVSDLTETFYDIGEREIKKGPDKGNKVREVTLKPDYSNGIGAFDAEILQDAEGVKPTLKTRVLFGLDLPDRNTLKRLETFDPKIYLISWKDSEEMVRYAFVITTERGDVGIWCSSYTNYRLVNQLPE